MMLENGTTDSFSDGFRIAGEISGPTYNPFTTIPSVAPAPVVLSSSPRLNRPASPTIQSTFSSSPAMESVANVELDSEQKDHEIQASAPPKYTSYSTSLNQGLENSRR